MIKMLSAPHSFKSNARRAAKKAGVSVDLVEQGDDGKWRFPTNGADTRGLGGERPKAPGQEGYTAPEGANSPATAKAKAVRAAVSKALAPKDPPKRKPGSRLPGKGKPAKAAKPAKAPKAKGDKPAVRPVPEKGPMPIVARLLARKAGATIPQLAEATGMEAYSVRFKVAQLKAYHGFDVRSEKVPGKDSRYFGTAPAKVAA